MENYIKLQSVQGIFDTSGSKNLCDFQLAGQSGSFDLSQSFINVNCRIVNEETVVVGADNGAPEAVFNQGLVLAESARGTGAFNKLIQPTTAVLVKNARMVCARGKVEDIRRVDCLRANLAVFDKSEEARAQDTFGFANAKWSDPMPKQPFNTLVCEGATPSQVRDHDIRIPLSSVLEMGATKVWDTQYYGLTRLNLELNLDKLAVENFTTSADTAKVIKGLVSGIKYEDFEDITNTTAVAGIPVGSADYPFTTKHVYESLEDSPWFIGQRCQINATAVDGATAIATEVVQISKIRWGLSTDVSPVTGAVGSATGKLLIEFTVPVGAMPITSGGYSDVVMNPVAPTTDKTSIVINNIELVAKMTSETETEPTQYTTYVAQEDSAPSASQIQKTYQIPANTTNVYIMFNNPIYSHESLDTYRLTIDGVDVTNRDVVRDSALHYDLLSQVYLNKGLSIGSIESMVYESSADADEAGAQSSITIIAFPVPLKKESQQIGLELVGTSALSGKIILYSEIIKEL
jgi:hypothetical protein